MEEEVNHYLLIHYLFYVSKYGYRAKLVQTLVTFLEKHRQPLTIN